MCKVFKLLGAALAVTLAPQCAGAAPVMPEQIVLFVCKVEKGGPEDQNSRWTSWLNLRWATPHSMMLCRREVIALTDRAALRGAAPKPFTRSECWRTGMMLGPEFDAAQASHNRAWRVWRVGCPTPTMLKNPDGSLARNPDGTPVILSWTLPDCGHRDTVVCEGDSAI